MPWERVRALTFERLQRQLERVHALSPHYRQKLDRAGVRPQDVRHPDDLARVPFFEKDEERECQQRRPPLGAHLCVDPTEVVRIHASSGTTGAPTLFPLPAAALATSAPVIARTLY